MSSVYSKGQSAEPVTNSIGMLLTPTRSGPFTTGQDGPVVDDYTGRHRRKEISKYIDRIAFDDEKPAVRVMITQSFLIGLTKVTVAEHRQFDPECEACVPTTTPAQDDAAGGISWDRAVAFCAWLSQKEGKMPYPPTEAEWASARRAETKRLFQNGDTFPGAHRK